MTYILCYFSIYLYHMYFLTLQDPNYLVKGSRDPLGFQVLWQDAGRELIPHLSTVSGNIRDFQVMALADYCRQVFRINDRDYLPFFLCFEQLMAYTRFIESKGYDGFNGIDKVRRVMSGNDKQLSLSLNSRDQLLSSQKSYGVWGKYNRPFRDMGISSDLRFFQTQEAKLEASKDLKQTIEKLVAKKGAPLAVARELPGEFEFLFIKPANDEKICYTQYLLADNSRGELFRLTNDSPELADMRFYEQLDMLSGRTTDPAFLEQLASLRNTERVLSPLNRIFRYLQNKSHWTFAELDEDMLITNWSKSAPLNGPVPVSAELSGLLDLDNRELVIGLVKRNSEVCARRGSEPWITITSDGIDINHFEGAFTHEGYDPLTDNDYGYFLNTWFHIYRQLN